MIKQSTVLMATPIALQASEKGIDLSERVGDIIAGLNDTTANINGFTEDNIAVDLPEYTALVPEHTETIEAVTDIIADKIRSSLQVISKYVKPTLKEVEREMANELNPNNVAESIFSYLQINMFNIEPTFFNSQFYPTAPAPSFNNVNSIRVSDLLQGSWPTMTASDLAELIAVPVPELQAYLSSPEEIKAVYDTIFVSKSWYPIFNYRAMDNGIANINNGENYNFANFRAMVIASMLVNKLDASEEPIPGIVGVGLDDYRTSLRVTRDLLTTMLYRFKGIWNTKAAAGIIVLDEDVKYAPADYGNAAGLNTIMGTIGIGYNNAVLDMFADGDMLSLSEFVVGMLFAKFKGIAIKDIISDKDVVVASYNEYTSEVRTRLTLNKIAIASKAMTRVLERLYANEEFKPVIDTMEQDVHPTQRVLQRIRKHIDLDLFFSNTVTLDAVVRGENSLMNTPLAALLAGALDCPIAQEILELNARAEPGPIEHQRKVLSHSIDTVILRRLVKG